MTAVFERDVLHFQYPENWVLEEESASDAGGLEVRLQAPSGALWTVSMWTGPATGNEMMDEVLRSIGGQYEGTETEAASDSLGGQELSGFDSNFYCLDLLVTNCLRFFERDGVRFLIMSQAESREFDRQELVFKAITTSLIQSLGRHPSPPKPIEKSALPEGRQDLSFPRRRESSDY